MTSSGADRHSTPDAQSTVRRFGQLAKLRPEKIHEYKRLHAQIWPEVARGLTENQVNNYSIWLKTDKLITDRKLLIGNTDRKFDFLYQNRF